MTATKASQKQNEAPSSTATISLHDFPVMDISTVSDIKQFLTTHMGQESTILLNAQNVERITTPCIQLLLSLSRLCKENSGKLSIKPSKPIEESFACLGLTDVLNEWRSPQ